MIKDIHCQPESTLQLCRNPFRHCNLELTVNWNFYRLVKKYVIVWLHKILSLQINRKDTTPLQNKSYLCKKAFEREL